MFPLPASDAPQRVDAGLLRAWPPPRPDADDDKEGRGRVVVVAGSREVPGSALLAGLAALRAGAGKLQLATSRSVAVPLAVALPEARVVGLPEDAGGAMTAEAGAGVAELAERSAAVVIGPGMRGTDAVGRILEATLGSCGNGGRANGGRGAVLVLDAAAIGCLPRQRMTALLAPLDGRVVLTPNLTEMAVLVGCEVDDLPDDRAGLAADTARELGAVVVLKGGVTYTAAPDGRRFADGAGNVGLATSGSGDVLAGLIGGLAARGADPLQAAVWGVHVHAAAGDRLAERIGPLGYLARELVDEVPLLLRHLGG